MANIIGSLMLFVGIMLMIISLFFSIELISNIKKRELKKPWYILAVLIGFFLIAYIITFLIYIVKSFQFVGGEFLIDSILFFGSIFVIIVLVNNTNLIKSLNQNNDQLEEANEQLLKISDELKSHKDRLELTQKKLEEKNAELTNTLEDFYTIRLGIEKDIELGKFKKENEEIKKRVDNLKKKK